jgi:hypothetical protein
VYSNSSHSTRHTRPYEHRISQRYLVTTRSAVYNPRAHTYTIGKENHKAKTGQKPVQLTRSKYILSYPPRSTGSWSRLRRRRAAGTSRRTPKKREQGAWKVFVCRQAKKKRLGGDVSGARLHSAPLFVRSFARSSAAGMLTKSYGREDPVLSNLHDMLSVGCSFGFVCIKEAAVKSL